MPTRVRTSLAAVAVSSLLAACSGGDGGGGVEPANRAPTIALQFSKIGVVRNTSVQLSVNVNDLDDDPLTVTWAVTRGAITSLNAANTLVRWDTPATVGVDSVTVEVSDGTATRDVAIEIKVGRPFNGSAAPPVFLKSESPYIVTVTGSPPRLIVNSGATQIEAGVEILLETANTVIDVTDSLIAIGTLADPIVIRPNLRNLTCSDDRGWWEGIKVATDVNVDGYVELDYAEIWYGRFAVRLRDQGSAVIRNSTIRCSGQNGVLHEGGGILVIEDTEVSNGAFDGIAVKSLTFFPDSVLIRGCDITLNGRTGLELDLDDQAQVVPIIVEYSNIHLNGEHGITLRNAVFPSIHYNRFFGNGIGSTSGLNHIWLFSGYPTGPPVATLDAACNFWGAPVADVATIESAIRDSQDTGTVGTDVVVAPWSNENPLLTTSTCVLP